MIFLQTNNIIVQKKRFYVFSCIFSIFKFFFYDPKTLINLRKLFTSGILNSSRNRPSNSECGSLFSLSEFCFVNFCLQIKKTIKGTLFWLALKSIIVLAIYENSNYIFDIPYLIFFFNDPSM